MYVVIIGAGEVGFHIASMLTQEGHEVALIDRDPEIIRRASEELDVLTIAGNGASKRVLQQARVSQANIVVAATDSDEVNMIACMAAKHVGVPLTIARVRNPDYLDENASVSTEFTGIDFVIQPEAALAEEIAKIAELPGALDAETFADGQVHMIEVQVDEKSKAVGKPLLKIGIPRNVLLTAVLREDDMTIPTGQTVLRARDRVFLTGKRQGVLEAAAMLSQSMRVSKRAMLLGCGSLGLQIATALETHGFRLTIFEKDYERSVHAAGVLRHSLVIHNEGLDADILEREGVRDMGLFIAATGDERLNMLSSLLAKRLGARRTISIVERTAFSTILESIGVDLALSPRRITASRILKFMRSGDVLSASILDKSAGEVLEFVVAEDSIVAGRPLRDTHFPEGAIVGALVQADGVHIAHGTSVPQAGDRAIVFALPRAVADVERVFSGDHR
ncbi:MAG TPA: Trk system potassium transporter TrkA [Thermoleophilia bacterium]|nr:Trk system potassium transporter TrkA [Thermoleophilia bacterium]